MRIVSGLFGGRRLKEPKNRDIRPTSDKVRGAVFNMLGSRGAIEGVYVLDCFCGTGALGLEAVSRGAAACTFIDKARDSLDLARVNAEILEVNADFILKDACKIGAVGGGRKPAGLVFLDPPYGKDLLFPALEALVKGGWMADGAWVVCESEKSFSGAFPPSFMTEEERVYGDSKIVLLRYQAMTPV